MHFRSVSILGPGLLGGSLGMALKALPNPPRVAMWGRRPQALEQALALGAADVCHEELTAAVKGSSLVVLCTPVGVMPRIASQIASHLVDGAIVTDVGSVKESLVAELPGIFGDRAHYVGSHPMAGSEKAGIEASRASLFQKAVCILTPDKATNPSSLEKVRSFWEEIGCVLRELGPGEHDQVIADVSHLPHVAAAALVNLVCSGGLLPLRFSGNGFRDTTRIASGPAEMWAEILMENRTHVRAAIAGMIQHLGDFVSALEQEDQGRVRELLENARKNRETL